ncbi:MAG: LPS-assembly protein LptD [Nitrospirae bacterium]|nr:LPS-assembly protein LptD [Nitrospirota bacterium]
MLSGNEHYTCNDNSYSWIVEVLLFILPTCIFVLLLSPSHVYAAEEQTNIVADNLQYLKETSTYIATGKVKIQKTDVVIEADEIIYNEQTSDMVATGNVTYKDPDVSINADKVSMNLNKKTGKILNAKIFYKKDNYHIYGKEIEKKGENYYSSPEAMFTTCDGLNPSWCFKGEDIEAIVGDTLKARNASFRIKNIPLLYSPYFSAPVLADRETGLLIPLIGYSDIRGFNLNIPFYWAISENRDATFYLDIYTKRGLGQGLEYRYVEPFNIRGEWWLYHLQDNELRKDYYEFKGVHKHFSSNSIGGFLNVNLVNEKDFYREFKTNLEIQSNRFLESIGEISIPFTQSRLFFLSQYWIDLRENTLPVSQKLPEVGLILNNHEVGPVWFFNSATVSNLWREEGLRGQRVDLYPSIFHTFGSDLTVSQMLSFRETAYFFQDYDEDSLHRESLEYSIKVNTRFMKNYSKFIHVIEPTLSYTLISNSEEDIPVFDSTEFFNKTSLIELALLNRIIQSKGEFIVFRASQGFDSNKGDRPFRPLKFELGIKLPVQLRLEADYNVNTGRMTSIISDIRATINGVTLFTSQIYNKKHNTTYYRTGIGVHPFKPLYLHGRFWYDAEENETKEIALNIRYLSQCWGLLTEVIKRPDDFIISVMFELKGITNLFKLY